MLVSVAMLFAFSVVILSAIVNPDLLNDNKKDVIVYLKLILMVSIPLLFDILYAVQANIMDNSLIEKIIVGTGISCKVEGGVDGDEATENAEEKCKSGGNGGQVIVSTLILSVVVPVYDTMDIDEDVQKSYNTMVVEELSILKTLQNISMQQQIMMMQVGLLEPIQIMLLNLMYYLQLYVVLDVYIYL